jgi:hypothetical protein
VDPDEVTSATTSDLSHQLLPLVTLHHVGVPQGQHV